MKKSLIKYAMVASALLAALALAACQPTPEQPPVVGKGDNHLEEMIASSAASPSPSPEASASPETTDDSALKIAALLEAVGAPETLSDSYTNEKGDVTVTIDAKVEAPPVDVLPAVEVKLPGFKQEQVDKLGAYFLKGAPVFTEEYVQTKEEIQEMIVNYGRQIEEVKKMNIAHGDEIIKDYQNRIKEYQEQYETAPEQRKRTPATLQFNDEAGYIAVVADLGKDEAASFNVNNCGGAYSSFQFTNDGKGSYDSSPIYSQYSQDAAPRGMKTTREDAQKAVTQCLSDLGITDMQVENVKTAVFYGDINDRNDENYAATANQCYAFELARTVMGVPVPYIESSVQLDTDDPNVPARPEPEYENSIEPERLEILVDDTGIVGFDWSNPSEIGKALSEHVTLTPFEDVVKRAKDNIFYKNYTAYGSKAEIKITSIKLGLMRIMRKDKPGEYMMVPVWDFIGNQNDGFESKEERLMFGDQSYVTINAIDGSWINRDWGY